MEVPDSVSGRVVTPRGVHLHPNGLHNYWMEDGRREGILAKLVEMGISWVVALSESDNLVLSGAAEALLENGIIPIVRFNYQFPSPWTHAAAFQQFVAICNQYGAPAIGKFANEPFDPREWKDGEVPPEDEAWATINLRWHQAAQDMVNAGGYAMFPDGPCYETNPFLKIGDEEGFWECGLALYGYHGYGKGRPIDYPEDDVSKYGTPLTMEEYREQLDDFADDPAWNEGEGALALMNQQRIEWANPNLTPLDDPVCWRGWQLVQHYAQEALGLDVQIAMVEGGWVPRDRAGSNPIDIRWPYTTPKMVAAKTLEMYADAPMFAVCPWLYADGFMAGGDVGWPFDSWWTWAFSPPYPLHKPVVQALIDNPPGGGDVTYELEAAHAAAGDVDSAVTNALALLLSGR